MRRAAIGVALALGLFAAGAGCKHHEERAAPPPPAVSAAERQRGTDACNDYVQRLCACAANKPELADRCKLKHAKPEALALALAVTDDPSSSADSVARARSEMAKIVAKCIEEAAQLPALGCP
ncbi:MAG TPA: hypothetical protein VHE35_06960 [Kofleriaceae bacterium]|nr:hypothetical protein [Kofleriaceae bacterium]